MKLGNVTGATPEERLLERCLELPPVPDAGADCVTHTRIGNIVCTSGMLPWINGELKFAGLMGDALAVEQGYAAFQLSALNCLSQLKSFTGGLSKIKCIHRLEGTGGARVDFHGLPRALDGVSHLVSSVFGDKGAYSRMIHSNPSMLITCATLVVF